MPNHCVFAQEQKGGYFEDVWKIKASAKPNGTKRIFRSLYILEHLSQNSLFYLKKCFMPCFISHMQKNNKNAFQTGEREEKRLKALYIQTPFPIFWCSLPTEKGFKTQHLVSPLLSLPYQESGGRWLSHFRKKARRVSFALNHWNATTRSESALPQKSIYRAWERIIMITFLSQTSVEFSHAKNMRENPFCVCERSDRRTLRTQLKRAFWPAADVCAVLPLDLSTFNMQ